jgi:hypothetical protein
MLRFGGVFVFLGRSSAAARPLPEVLKQAGKGAGQFAIIVDDVDAVCTEIAGRGVQPLTGPADRDWGMRTATLVTLRLMRSRGEETVVTEDPSRATLIDKEESSLSEDTRSHSLCTRPDPRPL